MEKEIEASLEKIRPYLNLDGGDFKFIKYEGNYVYVQLIGKCAVCPFQNTTLNNMIYEFLKEEFPNLKGVINIPI